MNTVTKNGQILSLVYKKIPSVKEGGLAHCYSLRNVGRPKGMQAGFKGVIDRIKAFSETDSTEDLKKFHIPTLVLYGDDDQIVPIGASALLFSKLIKNVQLKIYKGAARHSLDP
jgi:pimeloyl-ACP methyl ester carboxylesterase